MNKTFILRLVIGGFFLLFLGTPNQVLSQTTIKGKDILAPINARQIGPAVMSGRVTDVAQHPTNKNVLLVGTAGGGVWKSTNGGVNYQSVFDDHAQSIGCVAFDPKKPNTHYWVGTGEIWTRNSVSYGDGIYKTTDGGKNWKKMGLPHSERISSILIHPENTDIMFVGVLGALWSDSEERGIYKTTDGGKTWEKIYYKSPKTGCSDLIMDSTNPDIMYAAMWEFRRTAWSFESGGSNSELIKSVDGGKTWTPIHNGFPKGDLGRFAIALAPSSPNILYTVVESADKSNRGLYRSDDAGKNWTHLNNDFGLVLRPFYFSRITVDPKNPDIIAKAGLFGSISRDGGKTFKNAGNMHADIHDIVFDFEDSNKIFFGNDGGVNISYDGGESTVFVDNIPVSQYYHVSVDQQEPYNIYGGLQDNGSWIGPSQSPNGIQASDWTCVGFGDGFRVYPHPTDPNIVYSEMQGAENVWRYNQKTKEIKVITPSQAPNDPDLRYNWNASLTTSPNAPDRLYLGSQFVHVSNDQGESWKKISPDLTTNDPSKFDNDDTGGLTRDKSGAENHCSIFTIAESENNENLIWVGTDDGLVHITQDGGKNWDNVTKNISDLPANTWCYHIEASKDNPARAYAVFDGHTKGDMNTYVYMTNDYGKTWASLATDELKGSARAFQEDIFDPNILYLGTEYGLFISLDQGKTWSKFENNFPTVAVHYLTMSHTGDLVAGTHGRGIIIIDNLKFIRNINAEIANSDFYFLDTEPHEFFEETTFGGYGGNVTEFVGSNPNRNIPIVYYLKKKPFFGKTTLKIVDAEGKDVVKLNASKKKGLNIVWWNGTRTGAKVAKAHVPSFYSLFGPRVGAGKYTVVYEGKVGKFEKELELRYPSNSAHSKKDRDFQAETVLELYDMSENLAYLVHQIDGNLSWLDKNKAVNQEKATELMDELTAIKKELVVTSGDLYTDAQDPELRENLSELLYKVANFYGRPSIDQIKEKEKLQKEYQAAKKKFEAIVAGDTFSKFTKKASKQDVAPWKNQTFEEFMESK